MGRAFLVLIVAIGTALVVFWLLAPRLLSSREADAAPRETRTADASDSSTSSSDSSTSSRSGSTDSTITPPLNPEDREYEAVEKQRAPFYTWVRQNFAAVTAIRPDPGDQATLQIYIAQNDPQIVTALVHDVVAPYGKRYGFRRARFFLPNPPGNVDRYRLDSESTPDSGGVWNTFRK
jgi:hypothetical protein